jgi:hypothetical protein
MRLIKIPDIGAMFDLEEIGILAMQDGLFDHLLTEIVVQRSSRHS